MKILRRSLAWLLGIALLPPLLYLVAAVVLGAIPVNADFVPAENGVPIFIRTNGVHAEFVFPTRTSEVDWTLNHPASDMGSLEQPLPWIAFGWGDRDFLLHTPTWGDLTLRTALVALSGAGEGAMHVDYVHSPWQYEARQIRIGEAQYVQLAGYVRDSFVRDATGRPQRLDAPGYAGSDAFYAAHPSYVFWFTSNEWVRRGLATAGVRTARWAPFDIAIFWHLP
jgi:uncharacterized protein (TIGR02117 family)